MNNGFLDKATYQPVVEKAWKYLTTVALQPDGRIGYVQPIGEKAIPGQVVDANSTANFGVGAFLLAACEMVRFLIQNGVCRHWQAPFWFNNLGKTLFFNEMTQNYSLFA